MPIPQETATSSSCGVGKTGKMPIPQETATSSSCGVGVSPALSTETPALSTETGKMPITQETREIPSLLSFEHPTSKGFSQLEFSQLESEVICQLFPNPNRISSQHATKAAVETALCQKHSIFHFTGHGTYNFHNPVLSYLALADEDKLTLADICKIDLSNYRLVTLAAGETAITGDRTITAEYVGLVSGFINSGVAHVVSTLWTVESAASALVTIQFYQRLRRGKPPVIALAEATQWLGNVTNAELADFYAATEIAIPHNEVSLRRLVARLRDKINKQEPSIKPYKSPYFWSAFTIAGNLPNETN
ncbi:protein prenyltransferase, alpha subunit [Microseira wollei NIES-4236]|uniref:Protein prenyltransferase, alpha subunit n=2 Tax=Microseira wollei TaxID=467598 RepID=A0AAV3XLE8_9CYAN|nr:protein prenyltransferase, alpha subunit [Microseira wollei NIES-4236]